MSLYLELLQDSDSKGKMFLNCICQKHLHRCFYKKLKGSAMGVNECVESTVLLAEHKQQLSSTVLYICVNVGHEADQLASQCGVLLRSGGNVPQWR